MKSAILPNRNQLEKTFRENHIIFAAIFGSRAKGTAKEESDYDFLVEFEPNFSIPLSRFLIVKDNLEKALQKDIDLVTIHGLGRRRFKQEVSKTMKVLYDQRKRSMAS